MTIWVLLAVLAAAFLHALWNALIRIGTSRAGAMLVLSLVQIPIGLAIALPRDAMVSEAWPWVIGSGVVQCIYKVFLVLAHERGDLSRVYPLSRGSAPLIVALVGLFLLSDQISAGQYGGMALLTCGIALMARGVFTDGESRQMIPFALGSAMATASYTLIDGMGARVAADAATYVAWVYVADGLIASSVLLLWRGGAALPRAGRAWAVGAFASIASYGAYGISIWAMTKAPIAVVAALRETSILFAVLIGWLAFGEKMSREKAVACGIIVLGVLMTRL